jgi:DNA-binding transcriptional ArsR family regulator
MPRNQYDELEHATVLDDNEDAQEQVRPADTKRARHPGAERMRPLPTTFVRVPVSWFTDDPRPYAFVGQRGRLLFLLLHLSRWGQRPVILTSAVAERIGLSRSETWRHLARLEADGWVRVVRDGQKAVTVHPVIIAG